MSMACSQMALCKCSFSNASSPLTVLPASKCMTKTGFLASIKDSKEYLNIPPMGLCISPEHPIVKKIKKPAPCLPKIMGPWVSGSPTVMTTQGPLLNTMSKAMCEYRGIIQLVLPGDMPIMTTP